MNFAPAPATSAPTENLAGLVERVTFLNDENGFCVLRLDAEAGELVATFDGREVVYGFGELDELVLAYATTVHRAQESEYPAVVIPVMTQHYAMLARNLLYTGVTRGKWLVVLVVCD